MNYSSSCCFGYCGSSLYWSSFLRASRIEVSGEPWILSSPCTVSRLRYTIPLYSASEIFFSLAKSWVIPIKLIMPDMNASFLWLSLVYRESAGKSPSVFGCSNFLSFMSVRLFVCYLSALILVILFVTMDLRLLITVRFYSIMTEYLLRIMPFFFYTSSIFFFSLS